MKNLILLPGAAIWLNPEYIVSLKGGVEKDTCYIEYASSAGIQRVIAYVGLPEMLKALS